MEALAPFPPAPLCSRSTRRGRRWRAPQSVSGAREAFWVLGLGPLWTRVSTALTPGTGPGAAQEARQAAPGPQNGRKPSPTATASARRASTSVNERGRGASRGQELPVRSLRLSLPFPLRHPIAAAGLGEDAGVRRRSRILPEAAQVLEEENRNLKQLVTDLSLDKQMLPAFRITATCRASRVESPFTEPMRSLAARTSGAR